MDIEYRASVDGWYESMQDPIAFSASRYSTVNNQKPKEGQSDRRTFTLNDVESNLSSNEGNA